ncbi:MAG: resolvase protein, partial [uncultured bacterium]
MVAFIFDDLIFINHLYTKESLMKSVLKCAIYTRVSTDGQAEVEFNSCEAQENKILSFIKSQEDMQVHKTYSDPGFTGANTNRPALQEMFNDIREHKINLVIAYKIDRLTRSPRDFYQIIEYFEKYDISFISVTERFDTSTPSGRLLRNIMLTFAQFERELTGERVRDKLLERAQKGFPHGGHEPLGYRKENKRFIVDEQEAKAVKYIFNEYVKRTPLAEIVQGLIARNLKTKEGNIIDKSRVCHSIENPVCTGMILFKGKIYKGIHEPIISKELFEEAQNINPKRANGIRHYKTNYLGGLIQCAECGSFMTPTHSVKIRERKKTKYYYYRCTSTHKKSWSVCTTKQVSANRLEDYILSNLERVSIDESYIENLLFKMHNAESSKKGGIFGGAPFGSGF